VSAATAEACALASFHELTICSGRVWRPLVAGIRWVRSGSRVLVTWYELDVWSMGFLPAASGELRQGWAASFARPHSAAGDAPPDPSRWLFSTQGQGGGRRKWAGMTPDSGRPNGSPSPVLTIRYKDANLEDLASILC